MKDPTKLKLSAHEQKMLLALVELHDRLPGSEPLLREHELRLSMELGYTNRTHALASLIQDGLIEERRGIFDRAFSECVYLVRRQAAGQALKANGVKVAPAPEAPLFAAGVTSTRRPSGLAERAALVGATSRPS